MIKINIELSYGSAECEDGNIGCGGLIFHNKLGGDDFYELCEYHLREKYGDSLDTAISHAKIKAWKGKK